MIRIQRLTKTYSGSTVPAVKGIDLEVPSGSMVTLLGPSGCGKSTTLRSIAGLEKPDSGLIEIDGRVVYSSAKGVNLRANQRNLGMVFQSYAIWPHMTVFENVAYPLRRGGIKRRDVQSRVMAALSMVGLADLASRGAPNLSGGQQQRVALARALVTEPEVLLLDEPLSNLDSALRESMRREIRELQQRLGITALYVTHDQTEALALSDYVCVMSGGNIVDFGEPERIYQAPSSRFVAEFIGLANIIEVSGIVAQGDAAHGDAVFGRVNFDDTQHVQEGKASLLVRLDDVMVQAATEGELSANTWRGHVTSALFLGNLWDCTVDVNGFTMRAHVPRHNRVKTGDVVDISISPERFVALRADMAGTSAAAIEQPDDEEPVGDAPLASGGRL